MHLSALKSSRGTFSILELDRGLELAQLLQLDLNLEASSEQLQWIVRQLGQSLAVLPSAVVADPKFSLPVLLGDLEKGLVLRLESITNLILPAALPHLASNWGVTEIANNYAVAKLELWYHPAEEAAADKKRLVAELYEYCEQSGIDFLLKLNLAHRPDESPEKVVFQETQLQAVQELRSNCHLLALEYPGDALGAATLTVELDHPWIVSLTAPTYETNKQQLRTALENGAAGFIGGDVFWQGIEKRRQADKSLDLPAIETFIRTQVKDRVIELVRITNEFEQMTSSNS